MQWHEMVFSDESKQRNRRHLIGWLLWWIYVLFTIFFTQKSFGSGFSHHQPGLTELGILQYGLLVFIKSFLLLLTHMFFCYTVIYILLPNFLFKKNYLFLITGLLMSAALVIPAGYFLYTLIYPAIDRYFNLTPTPSNSSMVWQSIDAGLINAIKVTLIAGAITFLKRWWLRQKEKEKLEKEKIDAELQLLKAQIHPAFLFNTINNIILHAEVSSPKAPDMLIKLSDLLSFMLYECDAPKVRLEKEINMIKDYISLEITRQGEKLEMTFQIKGNCNGQLISPLLLLPFIDNSFSYCNNEMVEQAWINLDITIEDNNLSMKLINGLPAGLTEETTIEEQAFVNVRKRLQLLYPGRHDLKINAEQEMLMVHLNLTLEEATQEEQTAEKTNSALSYAAI